MTQTGIFTLCLLLARRALDLVSRLLNALASFSGGLASEIMALAAIWIIVPIFAAVFDKLYTAFIWLLHKFE